MTRYMGGGVTFAYTEIAKQCELCKNMAECRPYGPHGEQVCFNCMMMDEKAAKEQFLKRLRGEEVPNATAQRKVEEGHLGEHQDRDGEREATKTSCSNRYVKSRKKQKKEKRR